MKRSVFPLVRVQLGTEQVIHNDMVFFPLRRRSVFGSYRVSGFDASPIPSRVVTTEPRRVSEGHGRWTPRDPIIWKEEALPGRGDLCHRPEDPRDHVVKEGGHHG